MSLPSQQPYLLRALYEWCLDSGHTPYITVRVDKHTRVPQAYVKDGFVVLNVGASAVRNIHMDNEYVTFSARFGGVSQQIEVPVGNVVAIYARETGEGMAFDESMMSAPEGAASDSVSPQNIAQDDDGPPPPRGRPQLKVVK
ncbi:MAG: ClpXP protease specificity-enhancing factor [Hydrogenophilales bacterium 28-61-23]|nr:MAG: ClpXP protease specificity-enhancing factor [Hydrogenophilales bacterium 28-61-23]